VLVEDPNVQTAPFTESYKPDSLADSQLEALKHANQCLQEACLEMNKRLTFNQLQISWMQNYIYGQCQRLELARIQNYQLEKRLCADFDRKNFFNGTDEIHIPTGEKPIACNVHAKDKLFLGIKRNR